jgi:shikimate dehydrogenase
MNKKYFIIGNPVEHSLSPKIHNFWFNENKIKAVYEKKKLTEEDLDNFVKEIKNKKFHGANVTVPFKQKIIPYLDGLSELSNKTQSVNTIYLKDDKVMGDNTDVYGFYQSILKKNLNLKNKNALILGAGGVVPSIIIALEKLLINKIYIKNRTLDKAVKLKEKFNDLIPIKWNEKADYDIVINATSLGLKIDDKINFNFDELNRNICFYDTIYNPPITNLLKEAKNSGHKVINGKSMLILQAQKSFEIWTGIKPNIDDKFLNILND